MFETIECPKPAYDRVRKAGIPERINAKKRQIEDIFLYRDIPEEVLKKILTKARAYLSKTRRRDERAILFMDIIQFEEDLESRTGILDRQELEPMLIAHPGFLAYVVLGNEVFDFAKLGFPDQRSLEESVTSYCIGEKTRLWDEWIWRGADGNLKNEISRNEHGDLYVGQSDVSGKDRKIQGLFGIIEEFDTHKIVSDKKSVFAYQDWSEFLASLLKYARIIGKDGIPEIQNWRETLESIGGGTSGNYAEAFFGDNGLVKHHVGMMMEQPLLILGEKPEMCVLHMYGMGSCDKSSQIPCVKEGKLVFLRGFKDGKEGFKLENLPYLEDYSFTEQVVYDANDLPDALKATYKYFARERTKIPHIMENFLNGEK